MMVKKVWLGLVLVLGLNLQAADGRRTPENSPELYAKVLKLWSLNTGLKQDTVAQILRDKVIQDLNDDMVMRTIDQRLVNLELELFMQYTKDDEECATQ